MSVHPTTHRTILRGLVAAGTALAATLAFAGVASAAEPAIQKVDGNPRCASLGGGYTELKFDPVAQGRTSRSVFTIDVEGRVFDWSSTQGVDAVIVKGGPNANVYRYANEVTSGEGLHAPVNPSNGQFYGLSHISLCYDRDDQTPPAPPTCPDGQSMNGAGECAPPARPTCPEGQSMNGGGQCVPPQQATSSTPPVTVVASDRPAVAASSESRAAPAPVAVQVLGARSTVRRQRVAASARMQGPRRCVAGPFRQVLRGQGIRRVTVFVNGRKVRTLTGTRSSYAITIDPRKVRSGVLKVTARVEYVAASGRRAQTLRATALRCAAQAVQPRFAG